MAAKVVERFDAHYEVQDVEMGKVYRWCPEKATVECDCGETPTLAASATTCGRCGKDHALLIQEVLEPHSEQQIEYPWRYLEYPWRYLEYPWRYLQPHAPAKGV